MGRPKKYTTEEEKLEAKRIASKKYAHKNKEIFKEYKRKYDAENKEKRQEYYFLTKKELTPEQKERKKETKKKWLSLNKNKVNSYNNEYRSKRKLNDPLYKLKSDIRCLISNSFKIKSFKKDCRTIDIIGCTFEEFKLHLESQFQKWMTWDNRGFYNGELNYGWDIDHIIPLSSATTKEEIIKLNHYSNLQPLCSKINRDIKRNKIGIDF